MSKVKEDLKKRVIREQYMMQKHRKAKMLA